MARISDDTRRRNEEAVRAAMDRMLRGELPPGGQLDLKTLAGEAGVSRTAFYAKGDRPGPYQHLAHEFERRVAALRDAGTVPDPREAQIERLKTAEADLRRRLKEREDEIAKLKEFKEQALSQIAAQYTEIQRLRRTTSGNVHELPHRS